MTVAVPVPLTVTGNLKCFGGLRLDPDHGSQAQAGRTECELQIESKDQQIPRLRLSPWYSASLSTHHSNLKLRPPAVTLRSGPRTTVIAIAFLVKFSAVDDNRVQGNHAEPLSSIAR